MEPIISIVGFLGAGKTTLMKKLVSDFLEKVWSPYIILNDYEDAHLDAQQFVRILDKKQVVALSGSCICCTGLPELRNQINSIPKRNNAITFIEANGTTDACALLGFLGVGLSSQFSPPIQVSVVDVRNWQRRGSYNELEANQVQLSSLIVLNHADQVPSQRLTDVSKTVKSFNPYASLVAWEELDSRLFSTLETCENTPSKIDHFDAHWSSCSVALPDPIESKRLYSILDSLPKSILRVKACTKLDNDSHYSYVEMLPSGEKISKVFNGKLVSGPVLLTIGPNSNPVEIRKLIHQQSG